MCVNRQRQEQMLVQTAVTSSGQDTCKKNVLKKVKEQDKRKTRTSCNIKPGERRSQCTFLTYTARKNPINSKQGFKWGPRIKKSMKKLGHNMRSMCEEEVCVSWLLAICTYVIWKS